MKKIYGPEFNSTYIWATLVPCLPSNYDLGREDPPAKMMATLRSLQLMETHRGKNLSEALKKKIKASTTDSKTVRLALPIEFIPTPVDKKKKSKSRPSSKNRIPKGQWKLSVHKTYMFSGPKWDLYKPGTFTVAKIFDAYPSLFASVPDEDKKNLKGVFSAATVGIFDHPYGWKMAHWDRAAPTVTEIQTSLSNALGI